jgi:nicotinamide mononucleotide transporter
VAVVSWLNSDAFTIWGQTVIWSDLIGNTIGLAGLVLVWRRLIWNWPVQILAALILVVAYASAHLAGGVGKQLLVIGAALCGWREWRSGRKQAGADITVRFATWRERGLLAGSAALGTIVLGGIFTLYPWLSWSPWADAYIFVGTLVAMYAQARRYFEFWVAWLLVDIVGVPLAFTSGLVFSGLIYLMYFALVLLGAYDWYRRSHSPALAR